MFKKIAAAVGLHGNKHHEPKEMTRGDYEFMAHIAEYGKTYGTWQEFKFRGDIFKKNLKEIEEHNQTNANFQLGINHLSTWTHEEYKSLLGYKPEMQPEHKQVHDRHYLPADQLKDSVNWVSQGAVTGVKNQGQCGSCWSFSSTGAIEGAEFLHGTKKLTSLSEQQLVDCSTRNNGCKGGSMGLAFLYVEKNPLEREEDYAYTAKDGSCRYERSKGVGEVKDAYSVKANNAEALMSVIKQYGPVSIAVEADKSVFQHYKTGVLDSPLCGKHLDHGVLAVGYGDDYFLVKNSWGPTWGDQGYLKISNSSSNICGILSQPVFPSEQPLDQ